MRTFNFIFASLFVLTRLAFADDTRTVTGRVLDEHGQSVAGAAIDYYWRANGPAKHKDGKPLDPEINKEDNKLFWANEGQMAPCRDVTSDAEGRFSIEMSDRFYTLMAMDKSRTHGGLTYVSKQDSDGIEIRLHPLVRITGSFEGPEPGSRPDFTYIEASVPEDETRPLDNNHLAGCGSLQAKFSISLPPGRYTLAMRDDHELPERELTLTANQPEVDLGVLHLLPKSRLNINEKIKLSQTSGAMGDYKKHFGEILPRWHIVDARGISKDAQLSDFKGKWILINFWALNCSVCLRHDLPELAKFYEDHKAQRDRFEILSICIDCDERLKSIADVDRELAPIVKYTWNDKPLRFPVLLDPSMTTLERFGVPGYFTILVDPDGKLVEGDETVLAKKLEK
ncbi:MAG TPA: redoxin domain-containing protein [Lacipirellulaceae bacterium]|nr:redoxin domain-containing protein [Lacipirellulaceae bacterium]